MRTNAERETISEIPFEFEKFVLTKEEAMKKESKKSKKEKKPYETPKLTQFGKITELTQGTHVMPVPDMMGTSNVITG